MYHHDLQMFNLAQSQDASVLADTAVLLTLLQVHTYIVVNFHLPQRKQYFPDAMTMTRTKWMCGLIFQAY
jgi:hypothetical protein